MKKPAYYLWYKHFSTQEEYEQTKEKMIRLGFRVVTYYEGAADKDIHEGLRQLVKNYGKEPE